MFNSKLKQELREKTELIEHLTRKLFDVTVEKVTLEGQLATLLVLQQAQQRNPALPQGQFDHIGNAVNHLAELIKGYQCQDDQRIAPENLVPTVMTLIEQRLRAQLDNEGHVSTSHLTTLQ